MLVLKYLKISKILPILYALSLAGGTRAIPNTVDLTNNHKTLEESLPTYQQVETSKFSIKLINLNPHINLWHLLEVGERPRQYWHLENRDPNQMLELKERGITVRHKNFPQMEKECHLWEEAAYSNLKRSLQIARNPYVPICEGLLYVRLKRSSETALSLTEWSTEVLRKTNFGESLINSIKPMMVSLNAETVGNYLLSKVEQLDDKATPMPKRARLRYSDQLPLMPADHKLGIKIAGDSARMHLGEWYPVAMHAGIFVNLFIPALMPQEFLEGEQNLAFPISQKEMDKAIYLIAYDLKQYSLAYAVGTDEPPMVTDARYYGRLAQARENLIAIGSVPPYALQQAVGVFIGGFKERHSKIPIGIHRGKTYGYIEKGVELAPMTAGLATLYTTLEGKLHLAPWPEGYSEQQILRRQVTSARQNGVMLVWQGKPGPLVKDWRAGNWSADAQGLRQSLRSGVCLQTADEQQYLIFFAFTAATPSTMARVMQAFACDSAMHLDMNALMYMHNALFSWDSQQKLLIEYLNQEMLYPPDLKRHRFVLDNNQRDFFYVLKKNSQ